MKYMGSKSKIAKDIIPLMTKDRKESQYWVEPFAGGCNSLDKVCGPRIGNDNNWYLMCMWSELQKGWIPPDFISNDQYMDIKNNKSNYPAYLVGFVGIACSFGSKWWGGYARGYNGDRNRNYCLESKVNVLKQIKNLQDVKFYAYDYTALVIPDKSIIYCDPPYRGTTGYKNTFNSDEFWEWAGNQSSFGHKIYVSEFEAPEGWDCIYTKEITTSISRNTEYKKAQEKLFTKVV